MDAKGFAASARLMTMAAVLFFLVPSAQAQDEPVKPVDRPQSTIGRPSGTKLTICEAAQKARERNSPAAPGLEKRCRESKAVKPAARVKPLQPTIGAIDASGLSAREAASGAATGATETDDGTSTQAAARTPAELSDEDRFPPSPLTNIVSNANDAEKLSSTVAKKLAGSGGEAVRPQAKVQPQDGTVSKTTLTKCEAAKVARARNSPAAPGLEKQCAALRAIETSSVATSDDAVAAESRAVRKTDLQRQVAEQNQRLKEIAAELAQNQDESAIGKIGNLITGGDPQPSGVPSAVQKQGAGGAARRVAPSFQTENTIAVRVHYPKEYGFKADTSAFGAAGSAACSVFSVSAAAIDGSARHRNSFSVSTNSKLEDAGDHYACTYIVSQVPLDQAIEVNVAVFGPDLSSVWVAGGEPQPPKGQQRTVVDAIRTTTLNASQPRARLSYEMVYAPVPAR